jgi:hypothetical protein
MGVLVGRGHLGHPQGAGHSVPKGPGRGACPAFSFSPSFLSFSLYFSSSPEVNYYSSLKLALLYSAHADRAI